MNLLVDESVDSPIVKELRAGNYSVIYIAELEPGIPDEVVLKLANEKNALLITGDKDFGELVFRQKLVDSGVVLLRLEGLSINAKADIVIKALRHYENEMASAFTVISAGNIRIRKKE